MGGILAQYIVIAAGLIFAFLVLTHGPQATSLVGGLSSANVGAIKALQGR